MQRRVAELMQRAALLAVVCGLIPSIAGAQAAPQIPSTIPEIWNELVRPLPRARRVGEGVAADGQRRADELHRVRHRVRRARRRLDGGDSPRRSRGWPVVADAGVRRRPRRGPGDRARRAHPPVLRRAQLAVRQPELSAADLHGEGVSGERGRAAAGLRAPAESSGHRGVPHGVRAAARPPRAARVRVAVRIRLRRRPQARPRRRRAGREVRAQPAAVRLPRERGLRRRVSDRHRVAARRRLRSAVRALRRAGDDVGRARTCRRS